MKRVTFLREVGGHQAGDTVELDDASAQWLLDRPGYVEDAEPEGDGSSHHDELANTDPDHHGAVTTAPVVDGVPQPPVIDGTNVEDDEQDGFDPGQHTVDEVRAYLAGLSDDDPGLAERDRVLQLERSGAKRKSLLDV